jgi:hypothetical protein
MQIRILTQENLFFCYARIHLTCLDTDSSELIEQIQIFLDYLFWSVGRNNELMKKTKHILFAALKLETRIRPQIDSYFLSNVILT